MINPNVFMYAAIGVVIVVFLFILLQYVLLRNKLNRLAKKYKYFMNGEDGGSIELKLSTEVRELREMVASSAGTAGYHAAPVLPEGGPGAL